MRTERERVELHQTAAHLDNLMELQKFLSRQDRPDVLEILYMLKNRLHDRMDELMQK